VIQFSGFPLLLIYLDPVVGLTVWFPNPPFPFLVAPCQGSEKAKKMLLSLISSSLFFLKNLMRRRGFVFLILTAVSGISFSGTALLSFPAGAEPLAMEEVAEGVFVHTGLHQDATKANHGDIANIGFVVGARGVAVIDTGGSARLGQLLREAVIKVTDLPILYVINTHVHPDHIFGNAAFTQDRPEYIGHVKLPRQMAVRGDYYMRRLKGFLGEAQAQGTKVVPPTRTVAIGKPVDLDLGGRMLTLTAWPQAHTNNDLTVLDLKTGILWAGDLVFMERIPSMDGSLLGWKKVLERLRGIKITKVIPGHGPASASWPAAQDAQSRYFDVLIEGIRPIIKEGGTINRAVATVGKSEADKWVLFDDYNPGNVTNVFVELEWE
jgi:quinoprotein relay system zinc metallohydrolase 2